METVCACIQEVLGWNLVQVSACSDNEFVSYMCLSVRCQIIAPLSTVQTATTFQIPLQSLLMFIFRTYSPCNLSASQKGLLQGII
jgi:hypothetical protein